MGTFSDERIGVTPDQQGTDVPRGWKPTADQPHPPIRCIEQLEQGRQCDNWSISSGIRCSVHSTNEDKKLAQAKIEAGRLKLINLIDPAITTITDLLAPGTADQVRLKAATEILDRAGIVKGQEINVQVEHKNRGAEIVAQRLQQIRDRQQSDEEVIDVTEVDNIDPTE